MDEPLNSLGKGENGLDVVIPAQAARSRDVSPEGSAIFISDTLPFLRMLNSMETLPCFISGARATAGIKLYQLFRMCTIAFVIYGGKFTPIVSLNISKLFPHRSK